MTFRRTRTYEPYAWPGGYQIVYYTDEGDSLCADCAQADHDRNGTTHDQVVYYEGPDEYCYDCNKVLPAAYGDPDANAHELDVPNEKEWREQQQAAYDDQWPQPLEPFPPAP